jgi:hypothetical protein
MKSSNSVKKPLQVSFAIQDDAWVAVSVIESVPGAAPLSTDADAGFAIRDTGQVLPSPAVLPQRIVCRDVLRYLADPFPLVMACAGLLPPGGLLHIDDLTVPDDPRAARYIDSFERLRDPRHQRAYADYEWRGLLLDAGLRVAALETQSESIRLHPWAQERHCSPAVVERLHILLRQAPPGVRQWLQPQASGTPDAAFQQHTIRIEGTKPG